MTEEASYCAKDLPIRCFILFMLSPIPDKYSLRQIFMLEARVIGLLCTLFVFKLLLMKSFINR